MFYAFQNSAVVGYKPELVAFKKKTRRDEFCRRTGFSPVSAKDAAKCSERQLSECRRYAETIFDEDGRFLGIVLFFLSGKFAEISR